MFKQNFANKSTKYFRNLAYHMSDIIVVRLLLIYFHKFCTFVCANDKTLELWCFIGGGNRSTPRKPPSCHKSLTIFFTQYCIECTSPWAGFELTTVVVIGTESTGGCKSNYHMMTTTTAPMIRRFRKQSCIVWTQ